MSRGFDFIHARRISATTTNDANADITSTDKIVRTLPSVSQQAAFATLYRTTVFMLASCALVISLCSSAISCVAPLSWL